MKTKHPKHPKLYFNYEIQDSQVKLFYYCNQLNAKGDRISKTEFLDSISFSDKELIKLNKEEYQNLLIYINRQEKVLNNYLRKDSKEQYNIVKESLSLMYDFKKIFNELFINFGIRI